VEYQVTTTLAAASRSLKGYDDKLSAECIEIARKSWDYEQTHDPVGGDNSYVPRNIKLHEIIATSELLYTTGEEKYASRLVDLLPDIEKNIRDAAWCVARVTDKINNDDFNNRFREMLKDIKLTSIRRWQRILLVFHGDPQSGHRVGYSAICP